jgi:hypothetical protein
LPYDHVLHLRALLCRGNSNNRHEGDERSGAHHGETQGKKEGKKERRRKREGDEKGKCMSFFLCVCVL